MAIFRRRGVRGPTLALSLAVTMALPVAAPAAGRDARGRELFDHDCRSDLGWRRVTLFANGTVRVKTGEDDGSERMDLGEIPPDRLQGYLNRLAEIDLSEVDVLPPEEVEGEWIDSCRLRLFLPGEPARVLEHGSYGSRPLAVSRLLVVVEEVGALALPSHSRLPIGYRPEPGDLLRRVDEVLFEVISFTSDGRGVELQGVEQPLTLYLRPEDLREQFVELVARRER